MSVSHQDGSGNRTVGTVSSVSPVVAPVSRTGVVEVVVPNRDHTFQPGQYLSLDLQVGTGGVQTVIPVATIQTSVADGEGVQAGTTSTFVWVATPVSGQAGHFAVSRRTVGLGDRAGDLVAILSGLKDGERVVVAGAAGLSEGDTVSAPVTTAAVAQTDVSITEKGFEPATLTVSLSGPRRVTFIRRTDDTCAKQVVFPSLRITRDLPLGKPVTIELPPAASGTLSYVCGMDMLKGKVVIR